MNLPRPPLEGFARFDSYRPRDLDPLAEHRANESLASLTAQHAETDRIEGRILTTKTPAHVNPHE